MMHRVKDVTDSVLGRFHRETIRWASLIQQGIIDPEDLYKAVEPVVGFRNNNLFIPPDKQLALAQARNCERKWGFDSKKFEDLRDIPLKDSKNRFCTLVLDVSLGSVQHTFNEAWYWAAKPQAHSYKVTEINSNPQSFRLLTGVSGETEHSMKWRVVDLGAHWKSGRKIEEIRHPDRSPAATILWAASYFPQWVHAMDGTNIPFVYIPGYEVSMPDKPAFSNVLHIYWNRTFAQIFCSADDKAVKAEESAVPEFCDV